MKSRCVCVAFVSGLLAACAPGSGLSPAAASRNAAFGSDARGQGVDGLLVGHRLMAVGEHDLALRAYLRAASESGINIDVLSALGSANLALGRLGQAEQLLRDAVDLDPSFVPALNNLGVVLMERGQIGEARIVFQQAFAQDSGATDSIRENLRLAIARTRNSSYTGPEEPAGYQLLRRGDDRSETLSTL